MVRGEGNDELIDLIQFLEWGTRLVPAHTLPRGRYASPLAFGDTARSKYAGTPLVSRAVGMHGYQWESTGASAYEGNAQVLEVSKAYFARDVDGSRKLELSPEQLPAITALIRDRVLAHGERVLAQGPLWTIQFVKSADGEARWKRDGESGVYTIEVNAQLVEELQRAWSRPFNAKRGSVELDWLLGVTVA